MYLLQLSASVYADCHNQRGQTALELAVNRRHPVMIRYLVQIGVGRRSLECALIRASQLGLVDIVKILLDSHPIASPGN